MVKGKILIADDEQILTQSLQNILTASDYEVAVVSNGEQLIPILTGSQPDILLLDIYLGKMNGLQLLKKLKEDGWTVPVVMMTAHAEVSLAVEAMKEGAADFVIKPFDLSYLLAVIEKTMDQSRLKQKVKVLEEELDEQRSQSGIIGRSTAIKRVLDTATRLAASDNTTVLIEGESGTGKELLARFVFQNSSRTDKPFITLNCGAIPSNLAESEFFGYEKGAFTGATERMKQGKFELATGGTIFLDEIGELSLDMQVKLLRVLEERRFYRLGGTREIAIDVRVIAASNKNLAREVEAGKFREDLFYRLNVASLKIPPLRNRKDDIAPLAYAFLSEFCKKFAKSPTKLSEDAIKVLSSLSWKGNVRELRNAIERVVLLTDSPVIGIEHFEFLMGHSGMPEPDGTNGSNGSGYVLHIPPTGIPMSRVVKDLIMKTLEITRGNQVQAAKVLGMTRSRLRYRMDQLGIHGEQRSYKVLTQNPPEVID